jgi:putative tricarboxylic transport membrane protein
MLRLHNSIWLGAGMLLFALFLIEFLIPTWVITPSNVRKLVLSPDFWPYIVAGLLGLGGAILLLQYYFITRPLQIPEEHDDVPGGNMRIALVAAIMAVYYILLPYLGMILASVLAYVAFIVVIGLPRKVAAAIIAIVLPLLLYGFFDHLAGVPIPQPDFFRLP